MFASYNKNNAKGTLVGNWVEEEALRAATGFSRRKVPEAKTPKSPRKVVEEATHNRVLLHSHQNGQTTYETTLQASTKYGDGVVRVNPGPRASLRETQILEAARQRHEIEMTLRRESEERESSTARELSTFKASYKEPDATTLMAISRVPRGRNGSRVVDRRVEHLTRAEVDSLDRAKLDILMQQPQTVDSIPITRYSYAMATGEGLDFCASGSDSRNPFGRSSAFTNDIRDPTKRHAEAVEPASVHDECAGMTVHQRSALKRLLVACRLQPPLWSQLTSELMTQSVEPESNDRFVELPKFRSVFTKVLGDKDTVHTFMYFDLDHIGTIRLDEFIVFCENQMRQPTI